MTPATEVRRLEVICTSPATTCVTLSLSHFSGASGTNVRMKVLVGTSALKLPVKGRVSSVPLLTYTLPSHRLAFTLLRVKL